MDSERPGVQSVNRALDLLELVGAEDHLGVSAMARQLGLKTPTTHNLLRTLAMRGYVVGDNGRYRLGPAVAALGARSDSMAGLASVLRPGMATASAATGLVPVSVVLAGDTLRAVTYAGLSAEPSLSLNEWPVENVLDPASGRLLVAYRDPGEWKRFIEAGGSYEPDWDRARWLDHLAQIRETGVAAKHDPDRNSAVGVPVYAGAGRVVASIGAAMPGQTASIRTMTGLLEQLWAAAEDASKKLGCRRMPIDQPRLPTSLGLDR